MCIRDSFTSLHITSLHLISLHLICVQGSDVRYVVQDVINNSLFALNMGCAIPNTQEACLRAPWSSLMFPPIDAKRNIRFPPHRSCMKQILPFCLVEHRYDEQPLEADSMQYASLVAAKNLLATSTSWFRLLAVMFEISVNLFLSGELLPF